MAGEDLINDIISTHALTWSATKYATPSSIPITQFQLTRSRGARRHILTPLILARKFQLTRSRGARRSLCQPNAPTVSSFQLTRSRGARQKYVENFEMFRKFQLTRSRGARPPHGRTMRRTTKISTHALTWSATLTIISASDSTADFNSRAHVERDRHTGDVDNGHRHFNSRAHVERDMMFHLYQSFREKKFQLTRSRGARRAPPSQFGIVSVFQLTRSRGARHK